jgi:hypothetical protein
LHERLARGCNRPPPKFFDIDLLGNFFAHFEVRFDFPGFRHTDLVVIPNIFRIILDNLADAVNLKIAFISIDDDIKIIRENNFAILVHSVFLFNHVPEYIL